LHRIKAPSLIVWGEDDALISCVYAKEFASRIAGSRIEIIADCGHVPQVEQLEVLKPLVRRVSTYLTNGGVKVAASRREVGQKFRREIVETTWQRGPPTS
jgi:hypothetical protein